MFVLDVTGNEECIPETIIMCKSIGVGSKIQKLSVFQDNATTNYVVMGARSHISLTKQKIGEIGFLAILKVKIWENMAQY